MWFIASAISIFRKLSIGWITFFAITAGVALHSLYMEAEAIDIRLPGLKTSPFRDAALALHRGGVGYYAKSDFIHVDVGRVRRW